jgi:hypothetical protein
MTGIGAIISKVIDAMKSFIMSIESEGEKIIGYLASYSSKAATEISTIMKEAFTDIKKKISMIIRTFKSKIEAYTKRIRRPHVSSGTTISTRIKNSARDAFRKVETLSTKFGKDIETLLDEMKNVMTKIETGIKNGAVDALSSARRIGAMVVQEMEKIGKDAIDESSLAVERLSKDLELGGDFVYKHGLDEVKTGASIAIINPYLFGSVLITTGLLVGATKYEF